MSERRALSALLFATLLLIGPASAQQAAGEAPGAIILDLPFRARAMRGPGTEVAVAVATSGLLPIARHRDAGGSGAEEKGAPIAVVWGDDGGAALGLVDGQLTTTLLGAEAIEGLAAAEAPRGALPGLRRALSGPVSAYLAVPAGGDRAASLVIRERQPVAMSAEPQPVPILTATVPAGPGAAFAARRPRAARIDGSLLFLTVTTDAAGASALAVIGKGAKAPTDWAVLARGAPQAGEPGGQPMKPAAIADFSGSGRQQIAAVSAPDGAGALQLWDYAGGALTLAREARGYTNVSPGEGGADLAAIIDSDGDGAPELALPVSDRSALAILSLKGGITERARVPLPGLAAFGVATLGQGAASRLLVGLADGRIALVSPRP